MRAKINRLRITAQRGVTLIELIVSVVLMGLVTLATVSLFNVTNDSYRTVDADQELQNNARYAMDIIGHAVRHAGFQERIYLDNTGIDVADTMFSAGVRHLEGFDNSKVTSYTSATDFGSETSNNGINASDVLTARFYGSMSTPGGTTPDRAMLSCLGIANAYPSLGSGRLMVSSFSIDLVNGEPELYCKALVADSSPTPGSYRGAPIMRGVESFQVVFGIATTNDTTVPQRWLRGDQMVTADWPRVMAVRVGLVLRGAPGSANVPTTALLFYPLGEQFASGSTAGNVFTAPIDNRLRRAYTATFKVRNNLTAL